MEGTASDIAGEKRVTRETMQLFRELLVASALLALVTPTGAQESASVGDAESKLAQQLSNPVADLVSIPIQLNYDGEIGPLDDGSKWQMNIQPVYPVAVSPNWNLITRTIVPVVIQGDLYPGAGSQFGFGDVNASFFFSPRTGPGEPIWGFGPVLYLPTARDDLLGAEKWAAGPALVMLTMDGRWTVGALGNHLWSFAGDRERTEINNTLVQPFVSFIGRDGWSCSVQSESTYDWSSGRWSIPVNVGVSKLVLVKGKPPVSFQGGVGCWLESPANAADGLRFRLGVSFVLPKSRG